MTNTFEDKHKEAIYRAGQWTLMWRRFRRHKLAMLGAAVILALYLVVLFAEFFAYANPERSKAAHSLIAPQAIHFFDDSGFNPHVYGLARKRDPKTLQLSYVPDPSKKIPISFFAHGFEYRLFGVIPTDRHLIGTSDGVTLAEDSIFLFGTDVQGRDVWSRLVFATRVSMTVGLVGVALSLVLGITLGGISGLFGGRIDSAIQRTIEVVSSIPTIPLWMGLAASLPAWWSPVQVYFAVTLIISLVGWTDLARVTRGRFLALRDEDFVVSARLDGASQARIIFKHMVPSFLSHIIAATTLALPLMILSETALSFLGVGLRPPAISWGVMLQQAQNVQAIAMTPWLLIVALPVVGAVLSFNFLGDGIRDAADPYSH